MPLYLVGILDAALHEAGRLEAIPLPTRDATWEIERSGPLPVDYPTRGTRPSTAGHRGLARGRRRPLTRPPGPPIMPRVGVQTSRCTTIRLYGEPRATVARGGRLLGKGNRHRQPEGWLGQDDHYARAGRGARRAREAGPARRPRPAGEPLRGLPGRAAQAREDDLPRPPRPGEAARGDAKHQSGESTSPPPTSTSPRPSFSW